MSTLKISSEGSEFVSLSSHTLIITSSKVMAHKSEQVPGSFMVISIKQSGLFSSEIVKVTSPLPAEPACNSKLVTTP